jgi:hypothetical protein
MNARIGDVVIDKIYSDDERLAIVVGEGIGQPILLNQKIGVMMSTWEDLEIIGHVNLEAIWKDIEAIKMEHDKIKAIGLLEKGGQAIDWEDGE